MYINDITTNHSAVEGWDRMIGYIISFVIGMVAGVFIMALCAITKRN